MVPPDMSNTWRHRPRLLGHDGVETTELWCEPGRALVAEASSILLVKVELKKGDALYLNDGSYGSLFDAAHMKWPFPVKLYRKNGEAARVEEA
jgi:ornithine decarboxylase